jgi:hypothetical protein
MALNPLTLFAARVFNGFAPRQKPKALGMVLDFTSAGSNGVDQPLDLELVSQEAWLEFVQAMFIYNVSGGQDFTLKCTITNQTIKVANGKQAYLPFLAGDKSKYIASTGGNVATGLITIFFLNMPVPAIVW